jgi:hypothetical protein
MDTYENVPPDIHNNREGIRGLPAQFRALEIPDGAQPSVFIFPMERGL